jgi:hypothetical protein
MFEEQRVWEQFIYPAGGLKRKAVAVYQWHIERFQEWLWVLIHLYGGQSERAPELLGCGGRAQHMVAFGIFIEEGLVAFVATYHKGTGAAGISRSSTGICHGRLGSC